MAVVTWDGSTDTDYGTAANWDTGSVPTSSDDVIIANVTNDCVLDGSRSVNSFTVLSGGDFNGNTETLTVVGEADGSGATTNGYAVKFETGSEVVGTTTGITITTPAATNVLMQPTTGNVRDLTINHASAVVNIRNNTTLSRNLTITAGELTTTSDSYSLTVAGDVEIENGGTLTGNSSAISMGSLATGLAGAGGTYDATSGTTTITKYASNGKAIYGNGPINHNSGTFAFTNTDDYGSIAIQLEGGAGSAGAQFNDVTFSGNSTYRFPYYGMGAGITISGDLTISDTVEIKQWRRDMIVNGDVTINSGCEYDCEGSGVAGVSSDFTAETLTVDSGGTFKASSNTTTITAANGAPVNGRAWYIHNGATFTHNNGLCKFTASSPQVEMVSSGGTSTPNPFYDVEQTAGTMQWKGEHTKVLNNATLRGSQFNGSTGNLTVLGICRFTASTFNASDTSTSNHNFFGTLVIESGATVDVSAIDITVGSLRNLGGTIQ